MSSQRSRVAALTLLCALALASRADATGAQPAPDRDPESPAMTIEQGAEQLARVEPYVPPFLLVGFDEPQHGELTPDRLWAAGPGALLLVLVGALGPGVRGSG